MLFTPKNVVVMYMKYRLDNKRIFLENPDETVYCCIWSGECIPPSEPLVNFCTCDNHLDMLCSQCSLSNVSELIAEIESCEFNAQDFEKRTHPKRRIGFTESSRVSDSYRCLVCNEKPDECNVGILTVGQTIVHDDCLQGFVEVLDGVWDYSDELLENKFD